MNIRLIIFLMLATWASGSSAQTELQYRVVADSLRVPWEMLWAPEGRIWCTERGGAIRAINVETGATQLLASVPDVAEVSESGLLGMALHPDFPVQPYAYLAYTYYNDLGVLTERLVRYTYNSEQDRLIDMQTLLDGIRAQSIHNGARLAFGPDGKLYFTTGDAADRPLSQELSSLNGKVLRLNADGSIPDDNPITNSPVWSFGHRNAQGMTFSPQGLLYISEHGPSNDDEINLVARGRNYGWPSVEGYCDRPAEQTFCQANDVVEPLKAWTPTIAPAGLVYYGDTLIPEWRHSLLLVTLNAQGRDLRILGLSEDGTEIRSEKLYFDAAFGRLRGVCTAPDGRVFISTSNRDGRGDAWRQPEDDRILEIAPVGFTSRATPLHLYAPLAAYPNPAPEGVCYLSREVTFRIQDLTGRVVRDWVHGARVITKGLPAGVYFLQTQEGESLRLVVH